MTMRHLRLLVGIFVSVVHANAQEITIAPSSDGTIFQDSGDLSNSSGQHLFSGATALGRNNAFQRRALLTFDVASSVPANATITGASLSLSVNRAAGSGADVDFGLHSLNSQWNEGATDAGGQEGRGAAAVGDDVTWSRTGFGDWETEGGDFVAEASAVAAVGGVGNVTWTSDLLASNIQSWVDDPASNAGWILVGVGDPLLPSTAKRFASRENPDAAARPSLTIQYELAESVLGDFDNTGDLAVGDIGSLCSAIQGGLNPADFDLNGDSVVNLDDLQFWVEDESVFGSFLGDVNLDGEVSFADFLVTSTNFGQASENSVENGTPGDHASLWSQGDMNCDLTVSFADFLVISANFGSSNQQATAVPEPSGSMLAAFGLLMLGMVRTRKR